MMKKQHKLTTLYITFMEVFLIPWRTAVVVARYAILGMVLMRTVDRQRRRTGRNDVGSWEEIT